MSLLSIFCLYVFSLFPFSSEQVRVLLFRECDWTGRRLLFDSSAIEKVSVSSGNQSSKPDKLNDQKSISGTNKDTSQSFIDMCNGYGYTYNSAANDGSNIGEMVFGSVAMSFEGTSLKVALQRNKLVATRNSIVFFILLFLTEGTLASESKANIMFASIFISSPIKAKLQSKMFNKRIKPDRPFKI